MSRKQGNESLLKKKVMANLTNKEASKRWPYMVSVNGEIKYRGSDINAAIEACKKFGDSVQKLDWFHPSGLLASVPVWPKEAVERFQNL